MPIGALQTQILDYSSAFLYMLRCGNALFALDMDDSYRCPKCCMSFRSKGLMVKHQRHFCVGAEEEDDEQEQEIHQAKVRRLRNLESPWFVSCFIYALRILRQF